MALRLFIAFSFFSISICVGQETAETKKPQTDNSGAIAALVRLTRDQDPTVRMTAFNSIARIREETPEVVAAVKSGLEDDDVRVRVEAFYALNSAVEDGKFKVDALLTLIQDDDEQLALKAAEQLGKLGEEAVPHLVKALENEMTRMLIIRTLGSLGSNARGAIPALTELLKTDDANLRAMIANCLGEICRPPRTSRSVQGFGSRSNYVDRGAIQRLVDAIWPRYDKDGDGKLSLEEQSSIRSLDATADVNGDKHVSRDEFADWYIKRTRDRSMDRGSVPGRGFPPPTAPRR